MDNDSFGAFDEDHRAMVAAIFNGHRNVTASALPFVRVA